MNNLLRWRDDNRILPLLLIASIVVLVAAACAALWSRGTLAGDSRLASLHGLRGAYERVTPGRTTQAQLVLMGFDSARLEARSLSGLGVQEYFMPRTSGDYDRLDPKVRACFEAPDRCTALVFPLAAPVQEGFMAANAAPRPQARIVFLLKSGRVTYKAVEE